jgi:GDPmannose 4,6-dehydratase
MPVKKAIIFGSGGQDGPYLTAILRRENVIPIALTHWQCDVSHAPRVEHLIKENQPDYIFHFAARSSTSHDTLRENQHAIVDGTLNILESVKKHSPSTRVFLAGSILQLSMRANTVHLEQKNDTIYAAQRNASVAYARYYRRLGLDVYVGYFSYHDSPLRGPHHLAKRLAIEAEQVASGKQEFMLLRDPLDEKEWNFAGDMMEAVWAQVNSTEYEAVLGSGVSHTIHQYAKECFKAIGCHVPNGIRQEFTREGALSSRTDDGRFQHHFKTTLPELARMMVASS